MITTLEQDLRPTTGPPAVAAMGTSITGGPTGGGGISARGSTGIMSTLASTGSVGVGGTSCSTCWTSGDGIGGFGWEREGAG